MNVFHVGPQSRWELHGCLPTGTGWGRSPSRATRQRQLAATIGGDKARESLCPTWGTGKHHPL